MTLWQHADDLEQEQVSKGKWIDSRTVSQCMGCEVLFTVFNRKVSQCGWLHWGGGEGGGGRQAVQFMLSVIVLPSSVNTCPGVLGRDFSSEVCLCKAPCQYQTQIKTLPPIPPPPSSPLVLSPVLPSTTVGRVVRCSVPNVVRRKYNCLQASESELCCARHPPSGQAWLRVP